MRFSTVVWGPCFLCMRCTPISDVFLSPKRHTIGIIGRHLDAAMTTIRGLRRQLLNAFPDYNTNCIAPRLHAAKPRVMLGKDGCLLWAYRPHLPWTRPWVAGDGLM